MKKEKEFKKKAIVMRIEEWVKSEIDRIAEQERRTISAQTQLLLEKGIKEYENEKRRRV